MILSCILFARRLIFTPQSYPIDGASWVAAPGRMLRPGPGLPHARAPAPGGGPGSRYKARATKSRGPRPPSQCGLPRNQHRDEAAAGAATVTVAAPAAPRQWPLTSRLRPGARLASRYKSPWPRRLPSAETSGQQPMRRPFSGRLLRVAFTGSLSALSFPDRAAYSTRSPVHWHLSTFHNPAAYSTWVQILRVISTPSSLGDSESSVSLPET